MSEFLVKLFLFLHSNTYTHVCTWRCTIPELPLLEPRENYLTVQMETSSLMLTRSLTNRFFTPPLGFLGRVYRSERWKYAVARTGLKKNCCKLGKGAML